METKLNEVLLDKDPDTGEPEDHRHRGSSDGAAPEPELGPVRESNIPLAEPANDNRKLCDNHRAELIESGWTDDTIQKMGVYSTDDPVHIAKLLNWVDDGAIERAKQL